MADVGQLQPQPHRLSLATLRQGPFISATTHTVLKLGQRPLPVDGLGLGLEEDLGEDGTQRVAPIKAGAAPAAAAGGVRKKTRSSAPLKKGRASMTLRELIEANVIAPGRNKISVIYKGTNHQASLNKDGVIIYQGKRFQSATSFSIHCKRLQTPNKQGDDGWKSTLYEGQPLETFRKKYLHRIQGSKGSGSDDDAEGAGVEDAAASAEQAAAPAAEGTDQWVQCDRCRTWRIVPDEHWPAVEADDRDVWYCAYATWDVTQLTPYTPSCEGVTGQ